MGRGTTHTGGPGNNADRGRAGDRSRARDTRVVIVGGGGTGAAILHDLTLRGFPCTLVERGELTSGTTGRHHGQLHSGARYAVGDEEIARECMEEVRILSRIAAQSIEMNYGLFLALDDQDVAYGDTFQEACNAAGIPNRRLSTEEALSHEPAINPAARFAVLVPDGTIDAYRLPLQFFATAVANGAVVRSFTEVRSVESSGGLVTGVTVFDYRSRSEGRLPADVVINATGPWGGQVARRAGIDLPITPAPGTMVAVRGRLCNMVVSHLHPPGDGDIVVPQRLLSIVGTTQWETDDPDGIRTPDEDIRTLMRRGCDLVPSLADAEFHAAWTAARPLAGRSPADGRSLSRNLEVYAHAADGVSNFYSVIGGKATVLRAMGQAVSDILCSDLGLNIPCSTDTTGLLPHRSYFRSAS
jgi:glycerol-3-phosphate dehydrogenase